MAGECDTLKFFLSKIWSFGYCFEYLSTRTAPAHRHNEPRCACFIACGEAEYRVSPNIKHLVILIEHVPGLED